MAGLADFSADDIITAEDTGPNMVTMAGPGSFTVAEGNEPAPQAPAQEAVRSFPLSGTSEVLDSAAIEKVLARPVGQVEEPEPEQEIKAKPEQKPAAKRSSNERIQQIIEQRNQRDQRIAELTEQNVRVQTQMFEMQKSFQEQQLALERQRLGILEAQREREAEAQLSDVDKARRAFLREAKDAARTEISGENKALAERLAAIEAREQAMQEQGQQAQRNEYFRQQANGVLNGLLKEYTPEEQQALGPSMEEMLYTFCGTFGTDPVRAAPVFKQFFDKYVMAENGRLSRTSGRKVAESRQAPRAVPSSRATGGAPQMHGSKPISIGDLQRGTQDGRSFDNFVQYNAAGRPPLRPSM